MLKPSVFIFALFAMFSTSVLAQGLRVCPNVQVDEALSRPVIYSDCTIQPAGGGPSVHVLMVFFTAPPEVGLSGLSAADFDRTPTGDIPFGEFDGIDLVTEDMGPNYTGTCSDMAAAIPTLGSSTLVDGNVYCSRVSNTEGNQLWLRGTVDVAGNTWKDPIVLTNQPGVGTPYIRSSTVPVPVLPFWGLLSLAGLMGLFGFRKLRA